MANNGIDADSAQPVKDETVELENILIALDQVQQTVEVMHATVARLKNRIHANLESEAEDDVKAPKPGAPDVRNQAGPGSKPYRKRVVH